MSAFQVAVVADDTAPAAGTAVVRIAGLTAWPDNATVRILPIDEQAVPPNSDGWPWEAIRPLRVDVTSSGVVVVLGPEVVNSARLWPGTPAPTWLPSTALGQRCIPPGTRSGFARGSTSTFPAQGGTAST